MGEALLAPFIEQELLAAFIEQGAQKCPGEDGLSRTFFLTFWEQFASSTPCSLSPNLLHKQDTNHPRSTFDLSYTQRGDR